MLVEAQKRRRLALSMQRDGKILKEIGAHLGVSAERARQMILKAIEEEPNA